MERGRDPESIKCQDIDKLVEPIYRHCTLPGGPLHHAKRITRDMVNDAVEIHDENEN
jgi:hypothetical protein